MRVGFLLFACLSIAGCSLLRFGGNASGVTEVGYSLYCGTPSQDSEVHFFPDPNAFKSWIDYRNITQFDRDMAEGGALVVELGQRPTGGYTISLNGDKTGIHGDTLQVGIDWYAPRLDAAVSQAMTSECLVFSLPPGSYDRVKVVDQLGNSRGEVKVQPPSAG